MEEDGEYYWARNPEDMTTFVVYYEDGQWYAVGIHGPLRNFDPRQIIKHIEIPTN